MKHVDDAFWQKFAPAITDYAQRPGDPRLLHVRRGGRGLQPRARVALPGPRRRPGRPRLPVPGVGGRLRRQVGRRPTRCATSSSRTTGTPTATRTSTTCPTFLGNHDRGRIGMFIRNANPGASEAELLAAIGSPTSSCTSRAATRSSTTATSRASPARGGDQDARQDMFPSQSPQYNNLTDTDVAGDDGAGKNDNIGSDETPMDDNFDSAHPLYRAARASSRALTQRQPTRCATAPSSTGSPPAAPASTRSRASTASTGASTSSRSTTPRAPASASIPTYMRDSRWEKVYGSGPDRAVERLATRKLERHARRRCRRSSTAPKEHIAAQQGGAVGLADRAGRRAATALEVGAEPRLRRVRRGDLPRASPATALGRDIGTDDNAPYRVFHDVVGHRAGDSACEYRAVVLDNARPHALERASAVAEGRAAGHRARGAAGERPRPRDRRGPRARDAGALATTP